MPKISLITRGTSGGGTYTPIPPPDQPTQVVSAEKAIARTPGPFGQTGLTITTTVTAAAGNSATLLEAWISKDSAVTWTYEGKFNYSSTNKTFEFQDLAPTVAADGISSPKWIVKVLLSNTYATSTPSAAVQSAPFTVAQIGPAGANVCSNAHLGTAGYTSDADGNWSFAVPVIWNIATTAEVWTTQLQVRNVDTSRSPMPGQYGQWRVVGEQDHVGETVTENNIAGWPVLDTAFQYHVYEFQLLARSRAGTAADAWVVQTTAWSGAAYYDFTATVQAGSIPADRLTHLSAELTNTSGKLGITTGGVTKDMIGSVNSSSLIGSINANLITTVNANAIGSVNASAITTVNASAIGSVNASAITTVNATALTGNIDAARITTVNATALTGNINADRITAVNASAITAVNASAITAVNATAITAVNASAISAVNASAITSVNGSAITGSINSSCITSVNGSSITGAISSSCITSVNGSAITGAISSSCITSVNSSALNGSINAANITSVNTTALNGVIITSQLADGIMSSLTKFASDLRPIKIVATLPTLPDSKLSCWFVCHSDHEREDIPQCLKRLDCRSCWL